MTMPVVTSVEVLKVGTGFGDLDVVLSSTSLNDPAYTTMPVVWTAPYDCFISGFPYRDNVADFNNGMVYGDGKFNFAFRYQFISYLTGTPAPYTQYGSLDAAAFFGGAAGSRFFIQEGTQFVGIFSNTLSIVDPSRYLFLIEKAENWHEQTL